MARAIDADELQELCNRRIQDTWNSGTAPVSWAAAYADFKDDIDSMPTLTPPNEPLTRAERRQYTRQELEQLTTETAIYIEGAGIAQLQWGGLEIAEGCRDGYLYCKHIKPFSMDLYGQYWTAFDGPPERGKNNENPSGI